MPRNGSGTYSLPAGNPTVAGSIITTTWANTTLNDVASALTSSISNDGQTTPVANLPMGTYKHTNVASASSLTDYARYDQAQNQNANYLTAVSGNDTITATALPVPASYAAGQVFRFVSAGANVGTSVTINISGLGAKSITKAGSSALAIGDIPSGALCEIVYDGTQFQLVSVSGGINPGTINGNLAVTGNLTLSGSGKLITGDFSNATLANRVMFQTSTANANTYVGAVPNGTGTKVGWESGNYTYEHKINGIVAYTIDTSGNLGIGATPTQKLHVAGSQLLANPGSSVWTYYDSTSNYIGRNASTGNLDIGVAAGYSFNVVTPNGLGYGTGSGGTVTQATSKSTAVTLNKPTGQITMNNAALAANTAVAFILNNSLIGQNDLLVLKLTSGFAGIATYQVWAENNGVGSIYICVRNITAGSLSEPLVINFAIIKGAVA